MAARRAAGSRCRPASASISWTSTGSPGGFRLATRREAGFTLIEVVVAFALLALVLMTSFEIFNTGLARAADLDDYSGAIDVVQSRIAEVGTYGRIPEGETRGETEDGRYAWVVL